MMLRSIVVRHFGNCIGAIRRMGAVLKVFGGGGRLRAKTQQRKARVRVRVATEDRAR